MEISVYKSRREAGQNYHPLPKILMGMMGNDLRSSVDSVHFNWNLSRKKQSMNKFCLTDWGTGNKQTLMNRGLY